jgi:hypothetical protein
VNELSFSSFDIGMVQPRFVGAESQSARGQQAVGAYDSRVAARVAIQTPKSKSTSRFSSLEARVATQTSKSQSASRFSSLEVKLADIVGALAVFKGVVAESKGQLP